jgi:hypothetical protein
MKRFFQERINENENGLKTNRKQTETEKVSRSF